MMMRIAMVLCVLVLGGLAKAQTLDIYVIDVEGGNATLFVSPSHGSLLIDTGNAGAVASVRDAGRILDAMKDAGIFDNDVLVVDRSLKLVTGKIIVAVLNGELLVRRYHKNFSSAFLIPENNRYKTINLAEFSDFMMWGVVTYTIHAV